MPAKLSVLPHESQMKKGYSLMTDVSGLFGTFWPGRLEDDLLPRESGFQEQN